MRFPIIFAGILVSSLVSAAEEPSTAPAEQAIDIDKLSYGVGAMIQVRMLSEFGDLDIEKLIEGLKDAREGKELVVGLEEGGQLMQAYVSQKMAKKSAESIAIGESFLEENSKKEGVKTTDSGLQYEILNAGDGAKPSTEDKVTVHYQGTLINGEVFDSSYQRDEAASFGLSGVIPGWTEGLQLMSVGSKFRFFIPSALAYGAEGAGQSIGPNEVLIFEVELLSIDS